MTDTIKVALIPLDLVAFHPHNIRHDLGDLRPLTASIKRHGVMQPVVVERYGSGFRLRAGHRRTAAARLAGLTKIPAMIHAEALDDDEWLIASVQENVHRKNLDRAERLRTVRALLDLGCSRQGVADAFGVSDTTIGNWLAAPTRTPHAAGKRLSTGKLRSLIGAWRESGVDAVTILTELEQLLPEPAARVPNPAFGDMNASRTAAKIEAVEELLAAGESVQEIARRLDSTVGGLGKFLIRQNRHDLARPFNADVKRKQVA